MASIKFCSAAHNIYNPVGKKKIGSRTEEYVDERILPSEKMNQRKQ